MSAETVSIPKEAIAVFRLPIPSSGISNINDCIERVYGAGTHMLQGHGGWISITPAEDIGAPKTGRKRPRPKHNEATVSEFSMLGGIARLNYEDVQQRVGAFGMLLSRFFTESGGINFVEAKVQAPGSDAVYAVTVQKVGALSPAEKLAIAESRVAELEAERLEVQP